MDVRLPDGTVIQGVPDNISKAELTAKLARNGYDVSKLNAAPNPQAAGVPGVDPSALPGNRNVGAAPESSPSLIDRALGAGETALSLATGATTGVAGLIGGGLAGLGKSVVDGTFGTAKGADTVEKYAGEGMEKYTYAPRTEEGQRQTEAWGGALNSTLPLTPLTAEMGAIGQGARAAAQGARDLAPVARSGIASTAAKVAASNAAQNAADAAISAAPKAKLSEMLRKPKSTMSGVGAAAADEAAVRAERFSRFDIKPTEGQLTRKPSQIKFEREIAKTEEGEAVADHFAEQNKQVERVLNGLEDETGAQVTDLHDKGEVIVNAMADKSAAKKAEASAAYAEARAAGEMAEPVDVTPVLAFIKANKGKDRMAPIISMVESEVGQNGKQVGGNLDKLTLTPTPKRMTMTLDAVENLNQAINDMAEPGTPNMAIGIKLKKLLNNATEGKGGDLYRAARAKWADHATEFVDRDAINKLLRMKPGTKDRAVPFADAFDHLIIKGNRDSVKHVFSVLEDFGPNADPALVEAGRQAAAELRGALVAHIKEKMFSNGGADKAGNVVGSQKKILDVVTRLDRKGVLEAALGKDYAHAIRELRDLAVDIYTDPGVVNRSNNENAFVAGLDALHGKVGIFPGASYVTKHVRDHVKSRVIAKKIEKALNPKQVDNGAPTTSPQKRPRDATVH